MNRQKTPWPRLLSLACVPTLPPLATVRHPRESEEPEEHARKIRRETSSSTEIPIDKRELTASKRDVRPLRNPLPQVVAAPNAERETSRPTNVNMDAVTPEEKRILAAQQGDLEAFEALARHHQPNVFTLAWRLLGSETEADDVAQEVWIRVFRALPRFRFASSFSSWLYRIVVNQCLGSLKRRQRRLGTRPHDVPLDDVEQGFTLPDPKPGPRRVLEGRETLRAFHRAMERLPLRQRLAVTLVLIQGLSHREAGDVLGISEKTVSWHLFKARQQLMDELKEYR